jgi:glycosidase
MDALKREYPDLRVVGEVLDGSAPFVAFFQTGRLQFDGVDSGLDTLFDYPVYFALRKAFAQGGRLREVVDVLHQDALYPNPSLLVPLLGSHDVPRFMHEPQASIEALQLAATFLLTTRGVPQWYYGDEIAMRGGPDPDNRRTFPGGWPGDPQNAFVREGRTAEQQAVFEHVRALLHLRRDMEPLRRGRLVHLAIEDQSYVYARQTPGGLALVALNNAATPATLTVDVRPLGLTDGSTLAERVGAAGPLTVRDGRISVRLPARHGAVWTR